VSKIRRVNRPADRFAMISNEFLRDVRLSFHARGVGAWMLSHATGWECTTEGVAREAGVGRDQVRRALRELEAAGYLRRTRVRLAGGKLGPMEYEIQCTPFDVSPGDGQRLEIQALEDQPPASNQHKKITPQKIKTQEEPSGGATVPAAPAEDVPSTAHPEQRSEDPMPRPKPAVDAPALFDVERPTPPPAPFSAGSVVGAYVTSYQAHHDSVRPTRGTLGQVSRAAKALIDAGDATEEELLAAAVELGKTAFANLDRQVMMARRSSRGPSRVDPTGSPSWAGADEAMAGEADRLVGEDPELAAWMAGDQAQVSA